MTDAPQAARGLFGRIRASYWDFAGSARRMIAERPSEPTLLSFLMVAMAVLAFAGVIQLTASIDPAAPAAPDKLQTQIMEVLISRVFVGALSVYLLSAIAAPICRAFGGSGGFYETRVATIWAVLVAAPPLLLSSVASAVGAAASRDLGPAGAEAIYWVVAIVQTVLAALAISIWASCIAGAHGFRSPARVLGVTLAAILAVFAVAWGASQIF